MEIRMRGRSLIRTAVYAALRADVETFRAVLPDIQIDELDIDGYSILVAVAESAGDCVEQHVEILDIAWSLGASPFVELPRVHSHVDNILEVALYEGGGANILSNNILAAQNRWRQMRATIPLVLKCLPEVLVQIVIQLVG